MDLHFQNTDSEILNANNRYELYGFEGLMGLRIPIKLSFCLCIFKRGDNLSESLRSSSGQWQQRGWNDHHGKCSLNTASCMDLNVTFTLTAQLRAPAR